METKITSIGFSAISSASIGRPIGAALFVVPFDAHKTMKFARASVISQTRATARAAGASAE